jgi:hypothetical protein
MVRAMTAYRFIGWIDEANQCVTINDWSVKSQIRLLDLRILIAELRDAEEKLVRAEELEHARKLSEARGK